MDLYTYFYELKKEQGIDQSELAKEFGISGPHLSLVMNGKMPPSFCLAQRIEDYTQGKVTLLEIMAFCQKRMRPKEKGPRKERKKRSDAKNVVNSDIQHQTINF
jgi:transcriptional regulator with XRE-family HTH domain